MKLAVPSESDQGLESQRSGHFGHCAYFTVVTFDDELKVESVESVKNVDHDEHGCGGVIDYVIGLGVDGILAAGMGMPPYTRLTNAGVTVYSDRTAPLVGDAVALFSQGKVEKMDPNSACRH